MFAGYEDAPHGSAVQLRLLGGVFRLVLTGRAPELVPFYPCLGGTADPADVWPVLRAVIDEHTDELRSALEIPPQTNEVGRSAALLAGLFDVVGWTGAAKVRLLEVGASAGLNLLVDRFGFSGRGWRFGPATSPVQFAGSIEGDFRRSRSGGGAAGLRPASDRRGERSPAGCCSPPSSGRSTSTGTSGWPRRCRWRPSIRSPLTAAAAGDWLAQRLNEDAGEDVLTVVWHSITRLYWPAAEIRTVEQVLAGYGSHHSWPGCRWSSAPVRMRRRCRSCGPRCGPPGPGSGTGCSVRPTITASRCGSARFRISGLRGFRSLQRGPPAGGPARPAIETGWRRIEWLRSTELGRIRHLEQRSPCSRGRRRRWDTWRPARDAVGRPPDPAE